jgi:hypothetical protein
MAIALRVRQHYLFLMDGVCSYWTANDGKPYDWIGLLVSRLPKLHGRANEEAKLFCSEAATRAARFGAAERLGLRLDPTTGGAEAKRYLTRLGLDLFNGANADGIYPGLFALCPFLEEVTA